MPFYSPFTMNTTAIIYVAKILRILGILRCFSYDNSSDILNNLIVQLLIFDKFSKNFIINYFHIQIQNKKQ